MKKVTKNLDDNNQTYCCGASAERNEQYDAYYCTNCHAWIEDGCSVPSCDFCSNRPPDAK